MRLLLLLFCISTCAAVFAQPATHESDLVDFVRADSVAALYPRHSLADMRSLVEKLTKPLPTEVEKFRAIYWWICENIANDYELSLKIQKQRARLKEADALKRWNAEISKTVFKELLREQKTICTGYAYLLKEMCALAGMECKIIDGYGRTAKANVRGVGEANHSWNAVKLGGKWYLCDATWSSGAVDMAERRFVQEFNEAYFLADPTTFVRNHFPLDTAWTLLGNKTSLTQFLNGPIIYSGVYPYKIERLSPETFDITVTKGSPLTFSFQKNTGKVIKNVELRINGVIPTFSFAHPELHQNTEGKFYFEHVFKEKGDYVMHILFDNVYMFTYAVKVVNNTRGLEE